MNEGLTEVIPRRRSVLGYWPVALGAAAATFQIVTGVAADAVALTVAVAASCYLAAAALGRRWIAWVGVLIGSAVVTVSEVAGVAWWLGLSVYAVVLVLVGLLRRASIRPLTAQGVAMLGFAGLAVVAVLVSLARRILHRARRALRGGGHRAGVHHLIRTHEHRTPVPRDRRSDAIS